MEFTNQKFSVEIDLHGLNAIDTAHVLSDNFRMGIGEESEQGWTVWDQNNERWTMKYDKSLAEIVQTGRGMKRVDHENDRCIIISPELDFEEIGVLEQAAVLLKQVGATSGSKLGMRVQIDSPEYGLQSLKNLLTTVYNKQDIICKATGLPPEMLHARCKPIQRNQLLKIRELPKSGDIPEVRNVIYGGKEPDYSQPHPSENCVVNLHRFFGEGVMEYRMFPATLDPVAIKSNVMLAQALSHQALVQKNTQLKKVQPGKRGKGNDAFEFRTFLLRLGFIGRDLNDVRTHLLSKLDGDKAWQNDKTKAKHLNKTKER